MALAPPPPFFPFVVGPGASVSSRRYLAPRKALRVKDPSPLLSSLSGPSSRLPKIWPRAICNGPVRYFLILDRDGPVPMCPNASSNMERNTRLGDPYCSSTAVHCPPYPSMVESWVDPSRSYIGRRRRRPCCRARLQTCHRPTAASVGARLGCVIQSPERVRATCPSPPVWRPLLAISRTRMSPGSKASPGRRSPPSGPPFLVPPCSFT